MLAIAVNQILHSMALMGIVANSIPLKVKQNMYNIMIMLQNNFYSVNNYTSKSNWCQTTINDQMSVCTVSTGQFSPVRFKAAFAICMVLQY